jgi:hypothetical protein
MCSTLLHVLDVVLTVWLLDCLCAVVWLYLGDALGIQDLTSSCKVVALLYTATFALHFISSAIAEVIVRTASRRARVALAAVVNVLATCVSSLLVQALWGLLERGAMTTSHFRLELFYAFVGASGMMHCGVLSTVAKSGVAYDGAQTGLPIFSVAYLGRMNPQKDERIESLRRGRQLSPLQDSLLGDDRADEQGLSLGSPSHCLSEPPSATFELSARVQLA